MRFLAVMAAIGAVSLVVFAGEWTADAGDKDEGHVDCDAGGVDGKVGGLTTFETKAVTNGQQTKGVVGAYWNGKQYEAAGNPQVHKDNHVTHAYKRSGTTLTRRFMKVSLKSTETVAGGARQWHLHDSQWWWNTNATVTEHKTGAEILNPGTGDWSTLLIIYSRDIQGRAAGADASHNNQPPKPPANYGTSRIVAAPSQGGDTIGITETLPQLTKIKATAKWTTYGGPPSVDNAKVDGNQISLSFTFTTSFAS